jgi:hypothetical protein
VRERLPDYDVLVVSGRTLTVAGAPGRVQHQLEFHNGGDERVIVRRADFTSPQLEESAGRRPGVLLPTVVLHPGHARRVPISFMIPSHTPPGRYDGELVVAGQSVDVVVHVVEDYDLEVAPAEVVLESRPGDRTVRQIVCSNRGNVPLVIGEIGAVVLDDELTNCRSLRAVTAAWPDEGGEHDAVDRFVDLYVKKGWKKVVEHSGVLRVHTVGGPREIAPGETEVVDLEITLPDQLEPRTRYFASAPLYATDLTFLVVPVRDGGGGGDGGGAGEDEAPDADASRSGSRAAAGKASRTRRPVSSSRKSSSQKSSSQKRSEP